jgi:putative ATPase
MSESIFEENIQEEPSMVPKEFDNSFSLPLAARLAPKKIEEFAGQNHILGSGKLLRKSIDADTISSAVFYGPSGCGKTALAKFISSKTKSKIFELNAAVAGISDLKKILEYAKKLSNSHIAEQRKILVILDEIHHFNRTQQDVLLPSIEKGEIILIGITTENPFFYINSALLSRFLVFEFKILSEEELDKIITGALNRKEGLKSFDIELKKEARKYFINHSSGDARRLLNALELAAITTSVNKKGKKVIDLDIAKESIQKRALKYDKSSDEHYDHASAFIKSMRGSDPDAAVYWMAKMLKAGENPLFIARRILICAAEDVGTANPMALMVAQSAFYSADVLGMPEARIPLAQAAIYVAVSPKSNASYMAINAAMQEVENGPLREVPLHLKDGTGDGKEFGHGQDYKYPHDFKNHYIDQEYMPKFKKFYKPSMEGFESNIVERMKKLKK